jgi:hypothetical protein
MSVRKQLHFEMVHQLSLCPVENVGHDQFSKGGESGSPGQAW